MDMYDRCDVTPPKLLSELADKAGAGSAIVRDIHERGGSHFASVDSMRAIVDALPYPVAVVAPSCMIELANKAFLDYAGLGDSLPPGATCHRVLHRRDERNCPPTCPVDVLAATGEPATVTHTHWDAEGEPHFSQVTAVPLYDQAGRTTHHLLALQDIPELDHWRVVAESYPDFVVALDADGCVQFLNRTSPGVGRDGVVGCHVWRLTRQENEETIRQCLERVRATLRPDRYDCLLDMRDGLQRHFRCHVRPLIRGNAMTGFTVCYVDDTQQWLSRERQELMLQILRLLNQPTDAVATIRDVLEVVRAHAGTRCAAVRLIEGDDLPYHVAIGFDQGHITAESQIVARNGMQDNVWHECICGTVADKRTVPDLPCFSPYGSFWSNSLATDAAIVEQAGLLRRHRATCIAQGFQSMAIIPLRAQDRIIGLMQFADERPGLFDEDSIAFIERVGNSIGIAVARQRVSQAKDQFLQIASHDLRNPLSNILGFAEILRQNAETGLLTSRLVLNCSERICRQCSTMRQIVEDFLDFHALEDGQLSLYCEKFDLNTLLRQVADGFSETARAKSLAIGFCTDRDTLEVIADPRRISQVTGNLLSNAIKFSAPGAGAIEVSTKATLEHASIEVSDHGPGLRFDDMARLFCRYCRLSNHPTAGETSSGLGLAISKQMIELHGGTIGAHNNPDGGATFWFRIPLKTVPPHGTQSVFRS